MLNKVFRGPFIFYHIKFIPMGGLSNGGLVQVFPFEVIHVLLYMDIFVGVQVARLSLLFS